MVDLLKNMEFDNEGRLVPRLGPNLECTSEGLAWTGTFFIPNYNGLVARAPNYEISEGETYNSPIQSTINDEYHAPPPGCIGHAVIGNSGNFGGILLEAGSSATADVHNGITIGNPASSSYNATITITTNITVLVDAPGTRFHVFGDLICNGEGGLMPREINMTGPGPDARFRFDISGRMFSVTDVAPGDSAVFNTQVRIGAGTEGESAIGVYLWTAASYFTINALEKA